MTNNKLGLLLFANLAMLNTPSFANAESNLPVYTVTNLTAVCDMHSGRLNDLGSIAGNHYSDADFGIILDNEGCKRAPGYPGYKHFEGEEHLGQFFRHNNSGKAVGYGYNCVAIKEKFHGLPEQESWGCYAAPFIHDIGSSELKEIQALPKTYEGYAYGINDAGIAVGNFTLIEEGDGLGGSLPFATSGQIALQLPKGNFESGSAFDINNVNQVVGSVGNWSTLNLPSGGAWHSVMPLPAAWKNGGLKIFDVLPGDPNVISTGQIKEVNDFGLAVGTVSLRDRSTWDLITSRPASWQLNSGSSALKELSKPPFFEGSAVTVNNCGVIGGSMQGKGAVLWYPDGTIEEINVSISGTPVSALEVTSINNQGQLIVSTYNDGLFLLTPNIPSNCPAVPAVTAKHPAGDKALQAAKKKTQNKGKKNKKNKKKVKKNLKKK